MLELALAIICGFVGGGIASSLRTWHLSRISSQLKIELEDLKERLYVELKKRASLASRVKKQFDEEVFEAAAKKPVEIIPPKNNSNWWWPSNAPKEEQKAQ